MIRVVAIVAGLLIFSQAWGAPALTGLWLTESGDGVIAIAPCGDGVLCARIVGVFLDHADDPMPVDYRGVSQCNLPLISDAREVEAGLWKGHITDPRNGGVYGVELRLDSQDNLALRGFLGIPLLGRTQTWVPYHETPPADCRILPVGRGPERPVRAP